MPGRERTMRSIAAAALGILCAVALVRAAGHVECREAAPDFVMQKCTGRLLDVMRSSAPNDTIAVWVFLRGDDRESPGVTADPAGEGFVSPRAGRRISRRAGGASLRGYHPVPEEQIAATRMCVLRIRHVSRYFNAVSADVLAGEMGSLCRLSSVARVDRIAVYRRDMRCRTPHAAYLEGRLPADDPLYGFYGESLTQIDQIQAVELLEMGYNGSGRATGNPPVLVCVLDTGFNLDHEAFESLHVVAEYDFVQDDSVTSDQEGDFPGQERHGTTVLGVIAGCHEGDLIGPAWGAEYLLAKTEIEGQELRIEEDNWIAAVEWADSAGADIVTSSLGYVDWYEPADIDGKTAFCTRAAETAVSHGIVVVNSAGNLGTLGGLTPPADGENVIAVGAVYSHGSIVSFSSRGPTADNRIKPDLVAMGYRVHSVDHETVDGYGKYSGTSMSAPLVAGLCAVILEIHPDWGPIDARDALRSSASRSDNPDNTYGYGIPTGLVASGIPVTGIPESAVASLGYPNPFRETTTFELFFPVTEPVTARIYDCRGALVRTLIEDEILKWRWTLTWNGTNDAGRRVAGGVYLLVVTSLRMESVRKILYLP